jgi:hypothetical protein
MDSVDHIFRRMKPGWIISPASVQIPVTVHLPTSFAFHRASPRRLRAHKYCAMTWMDCQLDREPNIMLPPPLAEDISELFQR